MKKYISYIIVFFILLAIAVTLYIKDKPGTLKVDNDAFAISDTAAVTAVQFMNRNKEIVIERSGSNWTINKIFNAKPKAVRILLSFMSNFRIHSPVSHSIKDKALMSFNENSVEVTVKSGQNILKSYRIAENDELGSLVMMNNDDEPYVVKVPGFEGRLTQFFSADVNFWRDKTIFRYQPADILSIEVNYPANPKASFAYEFKDFNNIIIRSLFDKRVTQITKETAKNYLVNFASVSYARQLDVRSRQILDSLLRSVPFGEIVVKNSINQENKIKVYRISTPGHPDQFDLNRMYAVLQNDTVPVVVKYVDFDPIMKEYVDFAVK